ncbi:MAG: hypothetical protein HQ579_06250 [Candidatus Omnitrophica bacterium]|nr:hypothetical protein [Candidatus Omnitrophota bacterium]
MQLIDGLKKTRQDIANLQAALFEELNYANGLGLLRQAMQGVKGPYPKQFERLEGQLEDNIQRQHQLGYTEEILAEREEIIRQLDGLTELSMKMTFIDLCQASPTPVPSQKYAISGPAVVGVFGDGAKVDKIVFN